MKMNSVTHSQDILEDIRKIFRDEPNTILLITKDVFEMLKQTPGITINKHRFIPVSFSRDTTTCLIKNSLDNNGKETDIIFLNEQSKNIYQIIYINSLYLKKTSTILPSNYETTQIILIE